MNTITAETYSPPSAAGLLRHAVAPQGAANKETRRAPDLCGLPVKSDGYASARDERHDSVLDTLAAASRTRGADGSRHGWHLSYSWHGPVIDWRGREASAAGFTVDACDCTRCKDRVPACRHVRAAEALLRMPVVAGVLRTEHSGQVKAGEIMRAWDRLSPCPSCGAATWYVHLYSDKAGCHCSVNHHYFACVGCGQAAPVLGPSGSGAEGTR